MGLEGASYEYRVRRLLQPVVRLMDLPCGSDALAGILEANVKAFPKSPGLQHRPHLAVLPAK